MYLKKILFLSLLSCNIAISNPEVHFIGPWYGGMFASFNAVLHHLLWCEQNNQIPVVFWDSRCHYYNHGGFNGSDNAWEYYFQPVGPINPRPFHSVPMEFSPVGTIWCNDYIDQATRQSAQRLIDKYIKFNPIVQAKIDAFYNQFMAGHKTVGIHLRGTDKYKETKLVSPEQIIAVALQAADEDAQFFIASDERWRFETMKHLLGNRTVIFYDCYRAEPGQPLHMQHGHKPPRCILGEDVIIEVALLARCDLLVHTFSNVSAGALYFNAGLKNIQVLG